MNIQAALRLHPDAQILLSFLLKKDKAWLFARPEYKLTSRQEAKFKKFVQMRRHNWPVAYLLGHKEFFGLNFKVTPDVLVPRPETELLVELALDRISNRESRISNIIDIGTGSGNIIISIAKSLLSPSPLAPASPKTASRGGRGDAPKGQRGRANFFAIDSSKKALAVARANARRHSVSKKINFLHGRLLSPFLQPTRLTAGQATYSLQPSLILANLPYLTPAQYRANPDLKHEPKNALVAGPDGLKYYRELFHELSLSPCGRGIKGEGATILLEHDPAQVAKLQKLARQYFPAAKIKFHRDLADKWRICHINF